MALDLITPDRMNGRDLEDLRQTYWPNMERTRRQAREERQLLNGQVKAPFPENFTLAGAEEYRSDSLQKYMIPQRTLQDIVNDRPRLSIPLGPKGLGITAQRLTTKVEQPLNAIMEHPRNGFQWSSMAGLLLYEGWGASVTIVDPADWVKRPSAWEEGHVGDTDSTKRTYRKRYRVDEKNRTEEDDDYAGVDDSKARKMHESDLELFRASHLPLRQRALSIMDCAPIFGDDFTSPEGLIIEQEYSLSRILRDYDFGTDGLASLIGSNENQDGQAIRSVNSRSSNKKLTVLEYWGYDEDRIPYMSRSVKGHDGRMLETRWNPKRVAEWQKAGRTDWVREDGLVCIDLLKRFGTTRLPVAWRWGLQWSGARNADDLALPFTRPYRGNWTTADWLKTCLNISMLWLAFPTLLIQRREGAPDLSGLGGNEEKKPPVVVMPMTMTEVDGPVTNIGGQSVSRDVFEAIRMNLGEVDADAPGASKGGGASGFAMSLEGAFDKIALTTVRKGLGDLYEEHGSFVLEAGKTMPEHGFKSIMVFRATDVPTSDSAGEDRHEPMELDPDLIDETYTVTAIYPKSMSLPEEQQSMEAVARRMKTRRKHLEETGDVSPETTELELIAEDQRALPEYQKYLMGLVAQIQGAEELDEIAQGQDEGIMDGDGMAAGMSGGVAPALPPGMVAPPVNGAVVPGVPQDGSVTGFGGPSIAQNVLSGVMSGASMQPAISRATNAGGLIPAEGLVTPGSV